MNYFLLSLSFIAAVSNIAFPEVLNSDVYIVPTYSESNELSLQVLPEVQLNRAPRKLDNDWGPELASTSAIIMDEASGQILWQKNADKHLPIASITKLMTSIIAINEISDWDAVYEMQPSENALEGAKFPAGNGDKFRKEDIKKTALIASTNNAALAMAHSTGLSDEEFAKKMNAMAKTLGMMESSFIEPTGLDAANISTAHDVAILTRTAMNFDSIREPLTQTEHTMLRRNSDDDKTEVTVRTTNRLVKNHDPHVIAGKTGFTYEAGHCLATLGTNEDGNKLIVVVLGGPDETIRFEETQLLLNWAYDHYTWDRPKE